MKSRTVLLAISISVIAAIILSACGTPSTPTTVQEPTKATTPTTKPEPTTAPTAAKPPEATPTTALSDKLNILNWADYIDPQILERFKAEYGVEVIVSTFTSNDELLAKLQTTPGEYDIVFPSDPLAGTMISMGLLEPFDPAQIPNRANLYAFFQNPPYDPEGKYCIVYAYGTTGLAYNSKYVETPDSWAVLWDPQYKGKVTVLDSWDETYSMALLYLGYPSDSRDETQIRAAHEEMLKLKPNLMAFTSTGMEDMLASEEVWLMETWSGRALKAQEVNPAVNYVIPKEGAVAWADNMCIVKDAPHKTTAEVFLNFMLDPEISNITMEYTQYGTGNKAALEIAKPEYKDNLIMNPPEDSIKNFHFMTDQGEARQLYDQLWTELKAGD